MTEPISETSEELFNAPMKKLITRRKFIAGVVGVGAALAVGNRGKIAETIFSRNEDELLGSDFPERFPMEEIKFENGKVAVRDIRPESLREDKDIPLISMMGLGMDQKVPGYFHEKLLQQGEHTITLDFIGGGGGFTYSGDDEMNRQGDMLAEFIDKYSEEYPEVDQFDLLGMSLSTISVLSFARRHPDMLSKIRNMVLAMPVGLGESESKLSVIKRQNREGARYNGTDKSEEEENVDSIVMRTFLSNFISRPIRSLEELSAIAKAGNYPTVEELGDKGVRVGIIQGALDRLAEPDKLMEQIGRNFRRTVVGLSEEEREAARQEIEDIEDDDKKNRVKEGLAKMGLDAPKYKFVELSNEEKNDLDNSPPVRFREGGHEIMAVSEAANAVLRTIDRLNDPLTKEQVIENIKEHQ